MITIELKGFEELAAHFDGLAAELRQELIAKATLEAAKAVETELLSRTPIYLGEFSEGSDALAPGELLADIAVRPVPDAAPGDILLAVGPGKKTSHVARWVEYGHQMVTGGRLSLSGKGRGHRVGTHGMISTFVPPHPFLRPSQEAAEPAALAAFEAVLKAEIEAQ